MSVPTDGEVREVLGFFVGEDTVVFRQRRGAMSGIVRLLSSRPVVVGTVVKAALALGALVGLAVTDAQTEAIVAAVAAVLAAVAAITAAEQARVTPVVSVAKLVGKPVEQVDDLLRAVTKGTAGG